MQTFIAELIVTEKCNLRCPYCYVKNRNRSMTFDTFKECLKQLHVFTKQTGCQDFGLTFFGGEPLINFDLIKQAVPILKKDPLCKFFHIVSNMTLIDEEKVKWIKENNVPISWSFDGLSSPVSRPLLKMPENIDPRTGKQFKNILELYEYKKDLIFQLVRNECKVMICPENCRDLVENFKFFINYGINCPDFTLVRDDIWTEEDIKAFDKSMVDLADYYIAEVKKGKIISNGFFRLCFLDTVIGLSKGKRHLGCFACTHGCAITPSGDFYPCERFAAKDILKYDSDYDFDFFKRTCDTHKYKKCQECDLYQVCNMGCLYTQFRNGNEPIDSFCELEHIIYEQTFRVIHELKDDPTFKKIVHMWFNSVETSFKRGGKK